MGRLAASSAVAASSVEELWQARQFLNAGTFRRIPSTTMFRRRRISRDLGELSVCQDFA